MSTLPSELVFPKYILTKPICTKNIRASSSNRNVVVNADIGRLKVALSRGCRMPVFGVIITAGLMCL